MFLSTVAKRSVMSALALGVLLSGCTSTPFFFPITNEEREQVATLRAFRAAVSPQSHRELNIFLRDFMTMLSLGLPTEYGYDLSPYFLPLPKLTIPDPPAGMLPPITDGGKQLTGFQVPPQQIVITAKPPVSDSTSNKHASRQYELVMLPTPIGQSGSLKVTTSGAAWQPYGQSAAKAYVYGSTYTRLPDSIQVSAELNLQQNAGKATMNASLGSFQMDPEGTDLMLPQSLSFSGTVPGLSWYLNGIMSKTTAMKLQGTLTVQHGQRSDSYVAELTSSNGDLSMRLTHEEKAIDLTLFLQAGKLKGQARSRIDRRYLLADIVSSKDGKVTISYGDGSQEPLF